MTANITVHGPSDLIDDAFACVEWLAHIDASGNLDTWAPKVLSMFAGWSLSAAYVYRLFRELDGGVDRYGHLCWISETEQREWHWKLRRVRNDPTWGLRLFEVLRAKDWFYADGERRNAHVIACWLRRP